MKGSVLYQASTKGLEDKKRGVRKEAAGTLKEITGKNFGEALEKWQEWWDRNKETFLKGK